MGCSTTRCGTATATASWTRPSSTGTRLRSTTPTRRGGECGTWRSNRRSPVAALALASRSPGVEWTDRDGATRHAAGDRAPIDYDGDGHETDAVLDVDHDGHADAILIGGEPNRFRALYPLPDLGAVDTDGDGILDAITTDPPGS